MWVLSQEFQVELTFKKSINLIHHINTLQKKKKLHNDLKRWREVFDKIQYPFLTKCQKTRDRKLPQPDKVNLQKTYS